MARTKKVAPIAEEIVQEVVVEVAPEAEVAPYSYLIGTEWEKSGQKITEIILGTNGYEVRIEDGSTYHVITQND